MLALQKPTGRPNIFEKETFSGCSFASFRWLQITLFTALLPFFPHLSHLRLSFLPLCAISFLLPDFPSLLIVACDPVSTCVSTALIMFVCICVVFFTVCVNPCLSYIVYFTLSWLNRMNQAVFTRILDKFKALHLDEIWVFKPTSSLIGLGMMKISSTNHGWLFPPCGKLSLYITTSQELIPSTCRLELICMSWWTRLIKHYQRIITYTSSCTLWGFF